MQIEAQLGAGGMGVVYRVLAPTGARYALKTLLAGADADLLLRFQREGEAQARADAHPNVVKVHRAGQFAGRHYLLMDLAGGGDLLERLRHGPLKPLEAAHVVEQIARGVHWVHQVGVLHRDLKPANVLFDERGVPKVVDFGLARLEGQDGLTATGSIMGSPSYMAPEQAEAQRHALGPATDVYGLGAVLYHTLTGRPPFDSASAMSTMIKVLQEEPTPPRKLVSEIPPALEAVCLRALSKAPGDRYDSAEELADALRDAQHGGGAGAPNLWPVAITLAAALLLLTIGAAVVLLPADSAPSVVAKPDTNETPVVTTTTTEPPEVTRSPRLERRDPEDDGDDSDDPGVGLLAAVQGPGSAQLNRALKLESEGELEGAQRELEKALKRARSPSFRRLLYDHLARVLKRREEHEEAARVLTELLVENPHDDRALGERANAYEELGRWEEATADTILALNSEKANRERRENRQQELEAFLKHPVENAPLVRLARRFATIKQARKGKRFVEALQLVREALQGVTPEQVPVHALLLEERALAAMGVGSYTCAKVDLDDLLAQRPLDRDLLATRARVHAELGHLRGARKDCSEVIKAGGRSDALDAAKEVMSQLAEYDERLSPRELRVMVMRLGPKIEAARDEPLPDSAAQADRMEDLLADRMRALLSLGRITPAREDLKEIRSLGRWTERGLALRDELKQLSLEISQARPLIKPVKLAMDRCVRTHEAILDVEPNAVESINRAVAAAERYDEGYYYRGLLFKRLKRPEEAIRDLTHYLALRPRNGKAWEHRSDMWVLRGDPVRGVADLRLAIEHCRDPELQALWELKLIGLANEHGLDPRPPAGD